MDQVERVRVDRFIWERLLLGAGQLTPARCHVLLVLAVYMSRDGGQARPGLDNLCAAAGRSRSVVLAHLRDAVAAGWLGQVVRGGRRGAVGRASEYVATVPVAVWDRAEQILNGPPWRRPDGGGPSDQPDPDPSPGSRRQDPGDVPGSCQSELGEVPQGPTSGTLDPSQGPASKTPGGSQGPVFESQGPAGRTPSRSNHHVVPVETSVPPSPDVPRARDGGGHPQPVDNPTGDTTGDDVDQVDQLVDALRIARPEWTDRDIRAALTTPAVRRHTWAEIRTAAAAVAADPATRWPSRLTQPGPWWTTAAAAVDRPTPTPPPGRQRLAGLPEWDDLRNARGRALMRATWATRRSADTGPSARPAAPLTAEHGPPGHAPADQPDRPATARTARKAS